MTMPARHLFEFGPFRMDQAERLLLRDGRPVPLSGKAFDALLVLLGKSGRLVDKSELMTALWPDSFVEEGNLTVTISMIRKALGDEGRERKYIQTVSKCGYRFVADVRLVAPQSSNGPPTERTIAADRIERENEPQAVRAVVVRKNLVRERAPCKVNS